MNRAVVPTTTRSPGARTNRPAIVVCTAGCSTAAVDVGVGVGVCVGVGVGVGVGVAAEIGRR
ncbi:hypothetical protein C1I64_18280 [Rathayibacter festucae DSM 15932]|uniref:Uncharacterized protein n=1 Tax=Rathayibacter festucae DSM 15932 TaxID=1328866 RepID=A0A3Q9UZY5_9MICO|nr:hypothetical protein C1I64_18280 [Rathayibacter festucae DSM 15932]